MSNGGAWRDQEVPQCPKGPFMFQMDLLKVQEHPLAFVLTTLNAFDFTPVCLMNCNKH